MHHPVYNKQNVVVTTAITNLDLHDIARTSRTFGLGGYYVVNPMPAQRELAGRILSHWVTGFGAEYNPNRGEALGRVEVVAGLEDVIASIEARHGARPKLIATAARDIPGSVGYGEMQKMMEDGSPYVLCFGTGWGLTEEFIEECDHLLRPIKGPGEYNHLPVRGAVAIILDRLLGDRA
ncbi:MAG: RNA methyltransferase [Nitrospirae bacterium]|nr:RNA methyltransferase [Nitrospirota bacterium]